MSRNVRILTNVFISVKDNSLNLADVYFSDKIEKIVTKVNSYINWQEIDTKQKLLIFKKNFSHKTDNYKLNTVDGNFNLLIPGAIDAHVHFNTPGFERREDFEHASTAAAFGGVTTIIDMPCTSVPPIISLSNFRKKLLNVKNRSLIDFAFWGGISGNELSDFTSLKKNIFALADAGVVGFKVYTISGMKAFTDLSYEEIGEVAKVIRKTNKPLAVHAEDKNLIVTKRNFAKTKGLNTWQAYCNARSVRAESKAVQHLINIAKTAKAKVHIVHLSSKTALNKIRQAQLEGIVITAETCPQYLFFVQSDFKNSKIRNYLKTAPPVKFEKDKTALWRGLKNGIIEFVTTDHAGTIPHEEKIANNFWEVYGGIPGVEHRVPFLFSEGFLKGKLTLSKTIALLSENPAEFYGLNKKGKIKKNYDSDFTLVNLWKEEKINSKNMHSKGKYTPFEGVIFNTVVEKTFLRGKIIMNKNGYTEEKIGYGKFLKAAI